MAEYLGESSLGGEQSAPLNGKPTQQAYCAPGKMTDFSRLSRFGMTYKPLTESLGQELLTLFREDFLAKTLAPQGGGQALMENEAECGEKWRGSFVKYDPDTSLWRTHQCSLLGDLEEFLETWPQWGLMRNGECWEQRTLEHHIKETVFGFYVPTPTSSDGTSGAVIGKNDQFYSTRDGKPRKINQKGNDGAIGLGRLVKMWPTPDASPRGPTKDYNPKAKSQSGRSLQSFAAKFPTPQASDHRDRGNMSNPSIQRRVTIGKQIMLSQSVDLNSGQLNPTWVEWLMGWPLGWTDLKPLEMDKSHCAPQQHGES